MKRLYQLIFSFRKSEFEKSVDMLIGYRSTKMVLFHTAFNHRSLKENPSENNERMEFLGDAIISSVVAEYLFKKYPYKGEGFLTEMRSKMVNRQQLNHIAIQMGLKKMTRFNKLDGGLKSSQIFGNTLEALVGAIYLDKQYEFTKKWIDKEDAAKSGQAVVKIPVVVHVVWRTADQNISDEQIKSQIDILNKDFRKLNSDVNKTPAFFDDHGARVFSVIAALQYW